MGSKGSLEIKGVFDHNYENVTYQPLRGSGFTGASCEILNLTLVISLGQLKT